MTTWRDLSTRINLFPVTVNINVRTSVNIDKLQCLSTESFKAFLCFCCFCCLFERLKGSTWLNFFPRIFRKHYSSFRFAGRSIVQANTYPSDRRTNKNYFEWRRFLCIKAILSRCIKMMTVHLYSPSSGGARDLSVLPPIPRCGIVFAGRKKRQENSIHPH